MSKAISIHTICTTGKFDVKGYGEGYDVPQDMLHLYKLSQAEDIVLTCGDNTIANTAFMSGTIHNALQQMIITCRALTKRVKKDEEWSQELAEKNLSEFKIKPVPVPNQGKKEATPEDMVAKLKALGITPEELAVMMAR